MNLDLRRRISLGGCAAALAFGGLVTAAPAAAQQCPAAEISDSYSGECVLDMMSDSWHAEPVMYSVVHIGGPYYGSVNGIPCTPEHIGTCIGMSQNQVPHATPHATISHSP